MTDALMEATPDLAMSTAAREGRGSGAADSLTRRLPGVDVFELGPAQAAERNRIFNQLVGEKAEIVDLLAYAIYKQHKHDFRAAFFAANERDPTSAELAAYIIGESTPRRLMAYRFLAAAKLAGEDRPAARAPAFSAPSSAPVRGKAKGLWRQVAMLTTMLLGLIILAGVALKMR